MATVLRRHQDAVAAQKPSPIKRADILNADPVQLERIGRHIIIGYHGFADVKALVEKRAIAGIFLTDHNVRRRSVEAIRKDIDTLQSIRAEQGLPPLIVAADQEGGQVSRLSPPLKRPASLARVIRDLKTEDERRKAVETYAAEVGTELKRMGINHNLSPVVDLNLNPNQTSDGETRLRLRAIAADPLAVTQAAGWYCAELKRVNITCTIKHFPGMGRVSNDTHKSVGVIDKPEAELEAKDWVPFRALMHQPGVATMVGHVRLPVLDATYPASFSVPVLRGLLRERWALRGLVITDDFSMGAVTKSKIGLGRAAVKALNAGADYILLSFSEKHFDAMMGELLKADRDGEIDHNELKASVARMARAQNFASSD